MKTDIYLCNLCNERKESSESIIEHLTQDHCVFYQHNNAFRVILNNPKD